jgi:hypothetical protein
MTQSERLEKARQAVMRFRELLDLMESTLEQSEARYAGLFDGLSAEAVNLPEKERQREAARTVLDDTKTLEDAVLSAQFSARDYEREFEALYNRIYELNN